MFTPFFWSEVGNRSSGRDSGCQSAMVLQEDRVDQGPPGPDREINRQVLLIDFPEEITGTPAESIFLEFDD